MGAVNNPDVSGCVADAMAELSQFLGILHKRLGNQLPYDILTNLPSGIIQRDTLAKHSLRLVRWPLPSANTWNGTPNKSRGSRLNFWKTQTSTTSPAYCGNTPTPASEP